MDAAKTSGRLIDRSPSRKELEIEVPVEDVEKEYEKILDDYAGRVKLPGFRKGHAPREMVKNLFDHDILHDVYDALIPRVVGEEIKALGLRPVNVPEIHDLKHAHGEPLRCVASFEVVPDFELPGYGDIRVPLKTAAVEEAEVEKTLADLQAKAADYVPVEGRGVRDGDYVVVEIQGRDLKTKRFLPLEKAVVHAGHPENDAALNENLPGLEPGQERRFQASYPKDHPNRRVAGREVEYVLKVREIKEKKVPALDDDFAKTVGDYRGLDDLKDKIRGEMKAAREKAARSSAASEVLREIARRLNLELPESMVEEETVAVLRRVLGAAGAPRLAPAAFEELKTKSRQQAVEHLTNHLVLEKIARREGISVTEADVQAEIHGLAEANKVPVSYVSEALKKEGRLEELRDSLLFRKTVDFLLKNAIMS